MARHAIRPELSEAKGQGLHNIGEASALSGVSAKMIRHYEATGLIPPASRTFANYRLYSDADLHRLRFIKRSRTLGFSMKQIEQLLGLWSDPGRSSAEVKQLALAHARDLSQRIAEMQSMQRTLEALEVGMVGVNEVLLPFCLVHSSGFRLILLSMRWVVNSGN